MRLKASLLGLCLLLDPRMALASSLEAGFRQPPASALPWVHWFWVDGNITREGITADLESTQRAGIGGAVLMDVTQEVPPGPVRFLSSEWRALFKHAVNEAGRLGLTISMNNGPGWTGSGGPWITPELAMQKLVWSVTNVFGPARFQARLPKLPTSSGRSWDVAVLAMLEAEGRRVIPDYQARSGMSRKTLLPMPAQLRPGMIPKLSDVQDVSERMDAEGNFSWEVPAGRWTILRLGSMPTGRENSPARPGGYGLESDKLSRSATQSHFQAMLGTLIQENSQAVPGALAAIHTDSWEVGFQNWTPDFRREFQRLRGYDPLPYLAACTGRFVQSIEVTERFLWDFRRTIAELQAENYAGELARLAHAHGLQVSGEAYGNGPFDNLLYAAAVDVPMSEFWNETDDYTKFHTSKVMASAGHVFGKQIVAAEAFTAWPENSAWRNHPFELKPLADTAFSYGVNRLVFHRFAHQPWADLRPGLTLGMWGVQYERTQTWWDSARPWHEYLARCQYLLRQGRYVADVCYLTDEGAFTDASTQADLRPPLPAGYAYDAAPPKALELFSVTNGLVCSDKGAAYRVLVLPNTRAITPELLTRIRDLILAGATVVGPRPEASPSLAGFPACDARVQELANEIWGKCDGKTVTQNQAGQGRIVWGKSLKSILDDLSLAPDFRVAMEGSAPVIRWLHRESPEGHIYFLASPEKAAVTVNCEFRVKGLAPELWEPASGQTAPAPVWRESPNGTQVTLRFDPVGSLFVVFRPAGEPLPAVASISGPAGSEHQYQVRYSDKRLQLDTATGGNFEITMAGGKKTELRVPKPPAPIEIRGPWTLDFPPNAGAPARVVLDRLVPWNLHPEPGVRFFSGGATYRANVEVPDAMLAPGRRVVLNLGEVRVMAEVTVNEGPTNILWKPPFQLEAGNFRSGTNTVTIRVINLWPNRMIGDEQLPPDCEWVGDQPGATGNPLARWPDWLQQGKARPTSRVSFSTRRFYGSKSPLLESGLLGPVTLECRVVTPIP